MKLLELTRSFYPSVGGFEKSIMDKTKIYDALGIEYKIVATDFYNRLSGEGRLPNVVYLKQFTPYNITPALFKYLRNDYDVVSINLIGRFYSDVAIQYFSRTKTKIILTPHSFYHTDRYKVIKRLLQRQIFPYLLKQIDALITFTEYEKNEWMTHYNIPEEKIFVIPHYIETVDYQESKIENRETKYLLYVGRNDINKKFDVLIESFLQIHHSEYALYLTVNLADVRQDLQERVKNHPRIQLLGYVSEDQKQNLLMHAEAIVVPTSWEAFGYVAFEASRYAQPLLCSDIPVYRELLDGRGVIYFQNTVHSLTNALQKFVLLNKEEKQVMGAANFRRLSEFTFEKSTARYRALFERLLTADYKSKK